MLRSLKELERYKVNATDGDLGSVANFLFDDEKWAIRYLVVKTGHFLEERRVLVSPISFRKVDWAKGVFHLALTMDQIKGSPGLDADRPVSRQHERNYNDYYGYPYYWGTMGVWGTGYYPALLGARPRNGAPPALRDETSRKRCSIHRGSAKCQQFQAHSRLARKLDALAGPNQLARLLRRSSEERQHIGFIKHGQPLQRSHRRVCLSAFKTTKETHRQSGSGRSFREKSSRFNSISAHRSEAR